MGQIMDKVGEINRTILKIGDEVNGTKEITNALISLDIANLNLAEEELEIREYYDEKLGENYTARMKVEQDHYLFLEYALKHKISEIEYFHKGQDISSRKFIVFSGDCINCINLLIRKDKNIMNVFMRSSDALRLLPMDILSCVRILYNVLNRHGEQKKPFDEINFWITSCHIYDRDLDLANNLHND